MVKLTVCESCKVELSKIGLSPNKDSCRNCGNNPNNKPKSVKLNGVYSPTDSIKGFIPQMTKKECYFGMKRRINTRYMAYHHHWYRLAQYLKTCV